MNRRGMNPNVDEFLMTAKHWQEEYAKFRHIALDGRLTEEFKWCILVARLREKISSYYMALRNTVRCCFSKARC